MSASNSTQPILFDAEVLGRSFQELGVDVVEGVSTVFTSRWFHSRHDSDFFIWVDGEQRIVKYQLCIFGQVIEWNPIDGTRTGVLIIDETLNAKQLNTPAAHHPSSEKQEPPEVIRFDKKAQIDAVNQAIQVLSFVPDLSQEDRNRLISCLRDSPKLHAKARERALKIWDTKGTEILSDQRPKFWLRFKKWFFS
jgi:hypothetical protein